MRVLITGANGFVGSKLCSSVSEVGDDVVPVTRNQIGSIDGHTDWSKLLNGVDQVIHLAARAHVKHRARGRRLEWYRESNTAGALNLATQALEAGVRKFVFFSTIGVSGDGAGSAGMSRIDEYSPIKPANDYSRSKYEAERGLKETLGGSSCELLVIRCPLIYGVGAPGNFAKLLKLADSSLPLPFSEVNNARSMLSIENLSNFVTSLLKANAGKAGTYVLADNETISTAQIISHLRRGMGRSNKALPVTPGLMRLGSKLLGKAALYQQLCGDLVISNERAKTVFSWTPPFSTPEALYQVGKSYLLQTNS